MPDHLYLHHSTTGELKFFWDADQEPYPSGKFYMKPEEIDYEKLDEGIRSLIRKINETQFMQTVMSCEGHPERDNAYSAHPEIWIRLFDSRYLGHLFAWVWRAVKIRQANSTVFKDERIVLLDFVGWTRHGLYFVLYGRFVSTVENKRVIAALEQALEELKWLR